jgi:uncharacterized membrane protein
MQLLSRRKPWKAGLIYCDSKDRRIVVPNRFHMGWTLNMANPWAWALAGAFVGAAVAKRKK